MEAFDNLGEVGWIRGIVHPEAWEEVELAQKIVGLLAVIDRQFFFISKQVENFGDDVKLSEDIEQFSVLIVEFLFSVVLEELFELVKDSVPFVAIVHIDQVPD